MNDVARAGAGPSSEFTEAAARIRSVAVAVFAGFLSGMVGLGVGSRLAMRIVALLAGDADQGAITDAEAVVGEITFGGTVFLVLLGGAAGTFGGLLYAAMRRRLGWTGAYRGLTFGLIALTIFSSPLIEGSNPDFAHFGIPIINVAMFASLFLFFGIVIAPVYDALDDAVPHPTSRLVGRALSLVETAGLLLMVPATALVLALLIADAGDAALKALIIIAIFAYVLIVPTSSALTRRFRPAGIGADARGIAMSLVPLAPAVITGAALEVYELVTIF